LGAATVRTSSSPLEVEQGVLGAEMFDDLGAQVMGLVEDPEGVGGVGEDRGPTRRAMIFSGASPAR
jgi:hypothetical protein